MGETTTEFGRAQKSIISDSIQENLVMKEEKEKPNLSSSDSKNIVDEGRGRILLSRSMDSAQELKLKIVSTEVVAAIAPTREQRLSLSNFDLLLPTADFSVFFCYKKPDSDNFTTFASVVKTLKDALTRALVDYHVLAGELVPNSAGEPELLSNNIGVDFVEAVADIVLRDLDIQDPDKTVNGKLIPKRKRGVLAVQATELRCGGIVVGCTFSHQTADAYSANMFLVSWAEMARSVAASRLPTFYHPLICASGPAVMDPSIDMPYVSVSSFQQTLLDMDNKAERVDNMVSRIFYVTADRLDDLKRHASSNGKTRTKLESFSAFLWKVLARSASKEEKNSKMGIIVDGRTRLGNDTKDYFGNVISMAIGESKASDLVHGPLSSIADKVHDFLKTTITREHFLGLIDWVEARRPGSWVTKIYCRGNEDGPAIVVSSGQRFPVSKVDFGWGKPTFGSYYMPWGNPTGYVMPMPSPLENGDWVVYMYLSGKEMDTIEMKAGDVLRPLTSDYLGL